MSAASAMALEGLRVLELGEGSGAYCTKLLADMGADVIKVERPEGSAARDAPPLLADEKAGKRRGTASRSLSFLYMNSNKRGVTLDLDHPRGAELLRDLAAGAGVVVETFKPGYLDSLGLGYRALRALRRALVLTSITGFGQTGPHRLFESSDIVAAALGGSMYVVGEGDDPPVRLCGGQSDVVASTCAAASTMIALHHAAATGEGQHVDISSQEVTAAVTHICGVGKWLDDGIVPRRMGAGLFASVPSGTYRCSDGLIYLMVNRPLHWKALAEWVSEVTGNREVLDPMFEGPSSSRLEHRELLDVFIGEMTGRLTVAEAYAEGQRRHIAVTPVASAADVVADEHLRARGYFVDLADASGRALRYPGAPYRHSLTPWSLRSAAPGLGEHNREILGGELGVDDTELRRLAEQGVIAR